MNKKGKEKLRKELIEYIDDRLNEKKEDNITPLLGDVYYCIDCYGHVVESIWDDDVLDWLRLYKGNVWLDKKDCERYNKIDKKYRKLVFELNKGNPIDWDDGNQGKYFLCYDCEDDEIRFGFDRIAKSQSIYCTGANLRQEAINLIGEEDLKWYLKNYRG
jgi:hypothetical protein